MFDQNDNFSSRYYINSERAKVEKNRNGKGFK
jgi:hypothetical protein